MTENKRYTVVCDEVNAYSIFKDNERIVFDLLKYDAERICDELNQIADENEQLKKENYELHKKLGDFEPFERYMKERTSKTSVNDIIGFVKTDEQTNSVELKKELYK